MWCDLNHFDDFFSLGLASDTPRDPNQADEFMTTKLVEGALKPWCKLDNEKVNYKLR
jgi:hypothetical protein